MEKSIALWCHHSIIMAVFVPETIIVIILIIYYLLELEEYILATKTIFYVNSSAFLNSFLLVCRARARVAMPTD